MKKSATASRRMLTDGSATATSGEPLMRLSSGADQFGTAVAYTIAPYRRSGVDRAARYSRGIINAHIRTGTSTNQLSRMLRRTVAISVQTSLEKAPLFGDM